MWLSLSAPLIERYISASVSKPSESRPLARLVMHCHDRADHFEVT
jgi:hypothetical protein